jgi:cation:H+ antiporter
LDLLVLFIALVVILIGAELFTNGIEWFGRSLNLAEGAVGSVLAAVGTALPETLIPIIAIVFATGQASDEIGVGAILGAPFMLSTLAMFVTGAAILAFRRRRATGGELRIDASVLAHDMRYFAIAYALAIGSAFLPLEPVWIRWIAAAALIGIYAWYVRGHLRADAADEEEELAPLRFRRVDIRAYRNDPVVAPRLRAINLQVVVALGFIIVGAVFFVDAVEHLASSLGVSEVLLALVIAPVATELPEKFNSIIWVRQNKDTLAMGNITGAMVFQSCIPTVVGLVLASEAWSIREGSYTAFASAGIAFAASAAIFLPMARRGGLHGRHLLVGGVFYLAYLALVIVVVSGSATA